VTKNIFISALKLYYTVSNLEGQSVSTRKSYSLGTLNTIYLS